MVGNDPGRAGRDASERRPERATIYDIARIAGVNPSTVSRALNKPGRVSQRTEERIRAAAAELNFTVNPMARALPTGRTETVGLIVADITNPMFFELVRGVERTATENGYTLLLAESAESEENELRAAERLMRVADGVLLVTSRLDDASIVRLSSIKPLVLVNREVEGVSGIVPDVDYGIAEAIRHLSYLGHRSILYAAGPSRSWMSTRRWESIRQRCEWAHLEVRELDVGVPPTLDGGRHIARDVRASGATAVIAYNDLMAIGLMQELSEAGIRVPEEFSIVGFDNIFGSDFTTPPLTTIMSPLHDAGSLALRRLLSEVLGRDDTDAAGDLRTTLVIRGSTGRAPTA